MLMMVLWRQCVVARNSDLMPASLAAINAAEGSGSAGIANLTKRLMLNVL